MNINKAGKRMRQNWFDRELQNNGGNTDTLIRAMDTMKMYNDAPRIFKDLMYRNIDMETYGQYFLDNNFIEQLYLRAYNNWRLYTSIYSSVCLTIELLSRNAAANVEEIKYQEGIRNTYVRLANAYNFICQKVNSTRQTKDISYINCIGNLMDQFRNDIQSEDNDSLWTVFNQMPAQQYPPAIPQNNVNQNAGMPMQNNIVQPQQQNINQYGQQQCYSYQQQPQANQPIQNGYTFKVPIAQPQPQPQSPQTYFPNMFQNSNFK